MCTPVVDIGHPNPLRPPPHTHLVDFCFEFLCLHLECYTSVIIYNAALEINFVLCRFLSTYLKNIETKVVGLNEISFISCTSNIPFYYRAGCMFRFLRDLL
jgi:hypothetical protein